MHRIVFMLIVTSLVIVGCGTDRNDRTFAGNPMAPQDETVARRGSSPVPSPANFVSELSNPWLGFRTGTVFRYRSETDEGVQTIVVEVTDQKKTILGVATTVVRDRVYLDGDLIEDTFDWYAQDRRGNVWYFGEDSKEIENGEVVSTDGSWQAGVDGAKPGIIMLAHPDVGERYQQEVAEGVAEDMARVVSLSARVRVPFGTFRHCLQTLEWTPLEPGAREYKYYAPGVGLVLESQMNGRGRVELISKSR